MLNEENKPRVLIVEDQRSNREYILHLIPKSWFDFIIAEDGYVAIEKAHELLPDIILLDVIMPGIDGFETCKCLKNSPKTKDIPVIFMTGLDQTVDKVKGLNIGAVDYITKPIKAEELLARINIHLRLRNLTKEVQKKNLLLEEEIRERKKAEKQIEEQETAIRALYKVASTPKLKFEQRLQELLAMGRRRFNLDLGILAKIKKKEKQYSYQIIAASKPSRYPIEIKAGNVYDLGITISATTINCPEPIFFSEGCESRNCSHPVYDNFAVRVYIGVRIIVGEKVYGVLSFSSINARSLSFKESDRELLKTNGSVGR